MPSQQEEQEEIKRLSSRLENIQEQHDEHGKELKVHENEIRVIENNYEEDIPKLYDLVKQLQKQHDDFKTLVLDKLVDDLKKSYHDQYTVFKHKISTDIDTIKKSYHRYDDLKKEIDDLKKSYRQNKQQHVRAQGQGQGSYTDLKKEILELRQKYNYLKKNVMDDDFKKIKKSYQEHKKKNGLAPKKPYDEFEKQFTDFDAIMNQKPRGPFDMNPSLDLWALQKLQSPEHAYNPKNEIRKNNTKDTWAPDHAYNPKNEIRKIQTSIQGLKHMFKQFNEFKHSIIRKIPREVQAHLRQFEPNKNEHVLEKLRALRKHIRKLSENQRVEPDYLKKVRRNIKELRHAVKRLKRKYKEKINEKILSHKSKSKSKQEEPKKASSHKTLL